MTGALLAEATVAAEAGLIPIVQKLVLNAAGKKCVAASMKYKDLDAPDLTAVAAYLHRNPDSNALGVLMQDRFVNLDFDSMEAYSDYLTAGLVKDVETEETRITRTASGKYHYIYILPETWADKYNKTIRIGGLDVDVLFGRNNVEYVYPTTLPNGSMYTHCGTHAPCAMPSHLREHLEPQLALKTERGKAHEPVLDGPGARKAAPNLPSSIVRIQPTDVFQRHRWTRAVYPHQADWNRRAVIPVLSVDALCRMIPLKYTPKATSIPKWTASAILQQYGVVALPFSPEYVDWVHFDTGAKVHRDIVLLVDDGLVVGWVLATRVAGELVATTLGIETRRYTADSYRRPDQLWELDTNMPVYPGILTMAPRAIKLPSELGSAVVEAGAQEHVTRKPVSIEKDVIKTKMIFPDPTEVLRQTGDGEVWRYMYMENDNSVLYVTADSWNHPAIGPLSVAKLCFKDKNRVCIPVKAFLKRNLGLFVGGMACTAMEVCIAASVRKSQDNIVQIASSLSRRTPDDPLTVLVASMVASEMKNKRVGTATTSIDTAPACVKRMLEGEFKHDKRWSFTKVLAHTAIQTDTDPTVLRDMITDEIRYVLHILESLKL